jgi:hypothetical protein
VPPGATVVTFAVLTMVRPDTVTVAVQAAFPLPDAQLLPAVVEVTVLARMPLPVSGLFTVTE